MRILGTTEYISEKLNIQPVTKTRLGGMKRTYSVKAESKQHLMEIINARISNCYFGAYDKKSGYAKSLHNMFDDNRLNFKVNCEGGFKQEECLKLLQDFFKNKRGKKC